MVGRGQVQGGKGNPLFKRIGGGASSENGLEQKLKRRLELA